MKKRTRLQFLKDQTKTGGSSTYYQNQLKLEENKAAKKAAKKAKSKKAKKTKAA